MKNDHRISPELLVALTHFTAAVRLMNGVLDGATDALTAFGPVGGPSLLAATIDGDRDYARVARLGPASEVSVAFNLDEGMRYPELWVWVYASLQHPALESLNQAWSRSGLSARGWAAESSPSGIPWGLQLYASTSLTAFLDEKDPSRAMSDWARQRLSEARQIVPLEGK